MAHRRRSRSLSGSPEEHRRAVQNAEYFAKSRYKRAGKLAKAGHCVEAYKEYSGATVQYGMAAGNRVYAKRSNTGLDVSKALSNAAVAADKMFLAHCALVKKGK